MDNTGLALRGKKWGILTPLFAHIDTRLKAKIMVFRQIRAADK
jgi:hypothetical protein